MIWNSTAGTSGNTKDDVSSKNLVRLVEDQEIVKNIKLDEISIPEIVNQGNMDAEKQTSVVGAEFPIIRINDIVVPRNNIRSMRMSCTDFLPTISLSLVFTDTKIMHQNMVKDGDLVSLYMRASRNDAITFIRNDFLIKSGTPKVRNGVTTMHIEGELFIPRFNSKKNVIAYIGTSKEVMKKIAKDYGIGFAYNDFDDTDDLQNWICCNETICDFVSEVLRHSWKNETSFFKAWIDPYYNLCFVNVNKFLLSNENEEDIDLTFATSTIDIALADPGKDTSENERIMPKILSNMSNFKGSPFFISSWEPSNESSEISMDTGYQINSKTYIHNPNLFKSDSESCFEDLVNIPAYDQEKTKTHFLLRGRASYDRSENPDGEMERVNHNFVDTYNTVKWCGVEYMMDSSESGTESNNTWSGNVHRNYSRAECHNEINIKELSKLYITAKCDGLCLQVMRGERVPVIIEFNNTIDQDENGHYKDGEKSPTSRMYTGYYIVDGIEYVYKPSPSLFSSFSTIFTLKRREWTPPEQI